jgi:uncharacterized protein YmfQ (DUF2313 family)
MDLTTQYTNLLAQLLPSGPAWDKKHEDGTRHRQVLQGMAASLARLHDDADRVLTELDPHTTVDLLPDWERMLGLPDPCMPPASTLTQRRNLVLGRIAEVGGQSKQYLIDVAAAYGYAITITEHRYFRAGMTVGQPIVGEALHLTFIVHYPSLPVSRFRVGRSRVGEPLVVFDNATLECIINRIKPAQTFVIFDYTP